MNCPKCGSHSVTVLTFGDDYARKMYRCRSCTDSWTCQGPAKPARVEVVPIPAPAAPPAHSR